MAIVYNISKTPRFKDWMRRLAAIQGHIEAVSTDRLCVYFGSENATVYENAVEALIRGAEMQRDLIFRLCREKAAKP